MSGLDTSNKPGYLCKRPKHYMTHVTHPPVDANSVHDRLWLAWSDLVRSIPGDTQANVACPVVQDNCNERP